MRLRANAKAILYAGLISLGGHGLSHAINVPVCEGEWPLSLEGFETLDAGLYLDLPDPIEIRAPFPIEMSLAGKLSGEEIIPPLVKSYCQIGVTRMVIEFFVPFEDDTILGEVHRAIYRWSTDDDTHVGWQIDELGKRHICARGKSKTTDLCQ